LPANAALNLRVAVPEPVIVEGLTVASRPADGDKERLTTPLKPLTPLTVIVTVAWLPAKRGPTAVGLALIAKSTTFTVTVNEVWDKGPLVPLTVSA